VTIRAGVTLVELLVVVAILAITSTLTAVALRRIDRSRASDAADHVIALRRDAIAAGHVITRRVRHDDAIHLVTALPDGRVLADSALRLDPLTGLRRATTP
jgi:prepilin-type N-terminal cleavage/methylation domain-containing protein